MTFPHQDLSRTPLEEAGSLSRHSLTAAASRGVIAAMEPTYRSKLVVKIGGKSKPRSKMKMCLSDESSIERGSRMMKIYEDAVNVSWYRTVWHG